LGGKICPASSDEGGHSQLAGPRQALHDTFEPLAYSSHGRLAGLGANFDLALADRTLFLIGRGFP